ncbi:hypothetical protein SAMN06265360_11249 [Haloechinothrix alba]|uniref:Uncharacterized protein n=1 Tax=Haloechinothrix alba TaxID=664784 RepID=A0A238XS58_9PSEU|nr:hypothetical protein [Haloechinothrix alba]SNR61825.1 hypothetical protein SAMN06265360_11249 [Haloechinothrix alba]
MIGLDPFRRARTLRWQRLTKFAPRHDDDVNLVTDSGHSIPLDTVLPYERVTRSGPPREHGISPEGVAVSVVDPATLDETHAATRAWCRHHLGRDDFQFP